jgi:hypothetical protein
MEYICDTKTVIIDYHCKVSKAVVETTKGLSDSEQTKV